MRPLPHNRSRSVRTRSSNFQVLLATVTVLTASITLLASFRLESILDSESILEASMSSESGAQAVPVHRRFACMCCTARRGGRGELTFFNDYKSAAVHYSRSSQCNQSMRGIKAVTVQLNTRPQHIGDGVAGAGGVPGAWRPQPAPARLAPPTRASQLLYNIMCYIIYAIIYDIIIYDSIYDIIYDIIYD